MSEDQDWEILEGDFYGDGRDSDTRRLHRARFAAPESLFALANGYIGLRAAGDVASPGLFSPGRATFINGYYERSPIVYGESAYGFPRWHETMIAVPDASALQILVDGTDLVLAGRRLSFGRRLDLRRGLLEQRWQWKLEDGRVVSLASERFVSFDNPHLAAIRYRLRVSGSTELQLESLLDTAIGSSDAQDDPRVPGHLRGIPFVVDQAQSDSAQACVLVRTKVSNLFLACSLSTQVSLLSCSPGEAPARQQVRGAPCRQDMPNPDYPTVGGRFVVRMAAGQELLVEKFLCYVRDEAAGAAAPAAAIPGAEGRGAADLLRRNQDSLQAFVTDGFDTSLAAHQNRLAAFWNSAAVELAGPAGLAAALRFNMFHVFQAGGRDGCTNAPAKGLTGNGYEGHYFWDTEIYFLPLLTYTSPRLARALLVYRLRILDAARERARQLGHRSGALFPWRTISGAETSAYFPAGTAQYHINADIACALDRYIKVTGDVSLLAEGAAALLVETARLWMDTGHYGRDGAFRIDEVTGPDEYSALVNNNAYTNIMARQNLRLAADALDSLEAFDAGIASELRQTLAVSTEEAAGWRLAAAVMYLPVDADSGIICQDDSFMQRQPWDFANTPADRYPLLLHYHPLTIYRHQVLKQPDLLLAMMLRSSEFSLAMKKRCFDFYEPLTTGDSSLSHCIMSVMAAETGRVDQAWEYFNKTVRLDLDDLHGNAAHGAHVAAMGGSWLSLVYGFAGFRDDDGRYRFKPGLPQALESIAFRLSLAGGQLSVKIRQAEALYSWQGDAPLAFVHEMTPVHLDPGAGATFSLLPCFRAVIFDLDGVIADTARLHYLAWKALAGELGLDFDEAANERLKGRSRMDSLELLLGSTCGQYSPAQKLAMAERKNERYRQLVLGLGQADILPGMDRLIHDLRARGIKLGLASASHNAALVLDRLGLAACFDAIVDPGRVRPKPDPEIFLEAAAALNVMPRDCVAIEDAQSGIEAIRAAGIKAVGIGTALAGCELCLAASGDVSVARLAALFD